MILPIIANYHLYNAQPIPMFPLTPASVFASPHHYHKHQVFNPRPGEKTKFTATPDASSHPRNPFFYHQKNEKLEYSSRSFDELTKNVV